MQTSHGHPWPPKVAFGPQKHTNQTPFTSEGMTGCLGHGSCHSSVLNLAHLGLIPVKIGAKYVSQRKPISLCVRLHSLKLTNCL